MKLKSMKHEKIIAGFVSIAILTMLVLSGPAQAFVVSLNGFGVSEAYKGEKVSTLAEINIQGDERMPLDNAVGVFIDGKLECGFGVNGNECSNRGIKVELLSKTAGFGYGYGYANGYGYGYGYQQGYSNGKMVYNITIDSQRYSVGLHKIKIAVDAGNNRIYSSETREITFKPKGASKSESREVSGNQSIEFNGTGVKIGLKASGNGTITVSAYNSLPENASGFSVPALGKYYEIEDRDSGLILNETEIRVYYTDAEVSAAGINEDSLRLYYYNSTNNSWEKYDGVNGGVNTTGNYVWAITNHFSIWGVFGNAVTNNNNGGSGGSYRDDDAKKLPDEKLTIAPKDNGQDKKPEEVIKLNENTNKNNQPVKQGAGAGITGGVIGAMASGGGILILVFLIGIIGMGIAITLVRRRGRKQMKHGDITLGSNTEVLKGY